MADAEGTLPGAAAPRPAWGFRGPASAAVFACVCLGTLLLLGGALFFGATHRSASDPEELDLRHWRPTSTEHRGQQPSLLFKQVLEGADLAVELEGFTAKEVNLSKLEDQRIHLHTASREALLNFTFRANDRPTTLKRFYFTLFVSPLRAVRVWNFSRFCWDLASDVEHLSQSEGREVLLRNVGLSQGGEDRRKRAVSFEFQATSNFMVSITQGDEDDRGMEMFFSGQQVVSEVCEVSGHLKDGMTVEIIQGEFKGYRGRVRLGDGRFQVQLANGTKLQVGELQCRILEEDLHVLESEWKAEHLQHRCEGLVDAERTCSQDGCTVLLAPEVLSCEGYCQAHGIHCNQAWRSHGDSCHGATPATCAGEMRMRGDRLLCRCQALGLSRLGQEVPLNAHVLVDRHTGVVTKGPDHDGHVRVKMPKLLTLDRPFFRPWDADAAAQPRPWHGSCDELRQGDPVQLTEGHFRGHRGAVERCDPVSKQYTVILDQWLHVSAYNLVVLHCSALQPLGQNCSEDQCQIRPHSHRESCEQFCHAAEMRCFRAWRGQKGRCDMDQPLPCSAGAGTEKVCECAPDVYAGGNCFRHDLSYEPLNMPGQLRSHERSAKACAERCASVLGCAHFSYWSDGGCHLQDRHARLLGRPGVVVGPGDCLAAAARERPAEIGETDLCQAGVSYRPLDMDGQHRSHEPDLQHCAERCAAVAGCAHFSYWSDGGCHLQDSDAKEQSTLGAIAGHPKCQTDSGSSSATVRGVATTTTAPEEPGARASATARAAPSRAACAGLVDVVQYCSASKGCKATVRRMAQRSCFDYCEQLSSSCSRAFIGGCHGEEVDCDEITGSDAMTCHCHGGRADLRRSEAQELHQSQEEVQTWQFHCHEGSPKTWDMEKRWWCCRELEIGCGARSCWQAQHEGDWSMENRMWCCRAQQVGCDHEEVHHFDCSNGLRNWRNGWSPLKKKYCCKREHRGCDGTVAHREEEMPDSMQKVLIGGAMISNYRTRPQQPAEAFRWLTRSGGPVVFCILSGVAAASILHLLWKARSEGALSDSALKEGYLPVATEESF